MNSTQKDHPSLWDAVAVLFLFATLWATADANCATDKKSFSCNFASGNTANVVFPRLKAIEKAFWRSLPG